MASVALVVKMTAKAGVEEELAEFLAGAVELANQEAGTELWLALRSGPSTFWIVDAFPGEAERQAHIDGQIAAALFANADRLLEGAPEINPADVLAQK
jgi:quinol monooxygenase YgiN